MTQRTPKSKPDGQEPSPAGGGEARGAGGGAKPIPQALHNAAWVLQRTHRGSGPRPLGLLPCLVALPGGGSPDIHTLFLILNDIFTAEITFINREEIQRVST